MCCGRDRKERTTPRFVTSNGSPYIKSVQPKRAVSFIYVGNTAMTVTGPVSGREYRFDRPGARVEVHESDRILLASLRQLRQII